MACCLIIDTKVLLALLVKERYEQDKGLVDRWDLEKLAKQFYNSSPVFFMTDLTEQKIQETLDDYPEIYKVYGEGKIGIGNLIPNDKYFLQGYSKNFKEFIKRVVFHYVKGDWNCNGL